MKIRRKKNKKINTMRPNMTWLMATTAMLHFCAQGPAWAVDEPSKQQPDLNERDLLRKGLALPQRLSRNTSQENQSREQWRALQMMLGTSHQARKQRLMARLDHDKQTAMDFNIPPQSLALALTQFSEQTGIQFAHKTADVEGVQTTGVSGTHTPKEALRLLLMDTGMDYYITGSNTITVEKGEVLSLGQTQPSLAALESADTQEEEDASTAEGPKSPKKQKVIKVPEVVVKDVVDKSKVFPPPADGYKADEAVTSTRTRLPVDETPSSIGVVTQDIIRDTFSLRQTDAFEAVSGVSRRNARLGRAEGFNIRGFETNSFNGSLSGLRQNGLATDGLWAPDPAIVERYEIVKSPASIVGGASSPGGVVNRITKKPVDTNFVTSQFQAGSFDLYRGVLDANGVLPQNRDVRGRMIFAIEEGGNFVDDVEVRQYTVAPSVEISLFKGAGTLLLTGSYQKFDGTVSRGNPLLPDGSLPDIPRSRNFGGENGTFTDFEGHNSEIHYEHQFINDLTLNVRAKYSHSELTNLDVYGYAFGGLPPSGNAYMYAELVDLAYETFSGELFLTKEWQLLGQKQEVLVGLDHRDQARDFLDSYTYLGIDNIFNPANTFQAPSAGALRASAFFSDTVEVKQTGLFGQVVVRPIERLTLVLAGRNDWADIQRINHIAQTTAGNEASKLTGRVGATYRLLPWMNVYSGYQTSFNVQTASQRNGQLLPPETGQNVEVGAKLSLFDDRLLFTTAVFRTTRQNTAVPDPTPPLGFSIPAGEIRSQGVEFDANGQPLRGLNLNAQVSVIDLEVTKTTPGSLLVVGKSPFQVPRSYVGRAFATYELQEGVLKGFGFGGGVFFHGGFHLDTTETIVTEPYQRVDAVVFYRPNPTYDLTINVRNLADATYVETPGFVGSRTAFGAPVSVFGTLRVNFDPNLEWTPPWVN